MSPITVFFRTLLKSSAIFLGVTAIFLHPQLEWRSASTQSVVGAGQSPKEEMVDKLIEALKDSDAGVRRQVALTLARLNNPRALPALMTALKDADPGIRAIIVGALGELGDTRALPALTDALKDESVGVRLRAASALGELGDRGSIDALISAATDKSPDV